MSHCIHCIVSGRVQGVFYRVATQEKALALGLTGWVRNTPEGTVELEACGAPGQIAELNTWLWQGTAHANVTDVSCKTVETACPDDDFIIKY